MTDHVSRVPPRRVEANGIHIAYETFGDPTDPPLALVMGLGAQMVAWLDGFCVHRGRAGHFVVRFDNRDVGLSITSTSCLCRALDILRRRRPPDQIADMSDDVVGLLEALHLGSVHLVGASLGGQVAQTVALEHPGRLALADADDDLDGVTPRWAPEAGPAASAASDDGQRGRRGDG